VLWEHTTGPVWEILYRRPQRPCQSGLFVERLDKTAASAFRGEREDHEAHQGVFSGRD